MWSMPVLRSVKVVRRVFTLVELLVVVSIIAVLAAILLPSLTRAKQLATRTSCQSQLRQLQMCLTAYSEDSSDWFPEFLYHRPSSTTNENEWVRQYIQEPKKLLRCPNQQTLSKSSAVYDPATVTTGALVTFSYNVGIGTGNYPNPLQANLFFGWQGMAAGSVTYPRAPCPSTTFPGTTVKGASATHYIAPPDLHPAFTDGNVPFQDTWQWTNGGVYAKNHQSGQNVVLLDGHTEWRLDVDIRSRYRSVYW